MITIDETILLMRDINKLQGKSMLWALWHNHSIAMEPQSTQDATKHATQILDANYKKADLQLVVRDNCKHLKVDQQKQLLQLLRKYELLFDGTFGDWKTKPVSFQLKEGAFLYHSQAFSVPKNHKETLIKEVDRLEWASPSFIMQKKNKTVCFLGSFW